MPAPDTADVPELIIYNAIWSALEASQDFKDQVKAGNRIKHTIDKGQGVRYNPESKPVKQSGDLAEVDIDIGSFQSTPQMVTFCPNVRDEDHAQNYILTITVDDLGVNKVFQVKHTVFEALRNAGANLGVAKTSKFGVQNWSVPSATVVKNQDLPNQIPGHQTDKRKIQVTIRVRYRLKK